MSDLPIKAISVRQPWAWAIVHAGKDIENRDWPTRFRGPVCIHAAKGASQSELLAASRFMHGIGVGRVPRIPDMERGGIIGVAEIVDCVEASASPWFMGRYGFVLANVRPVPFITVRGALGFFNWRENLPQPPEDAR